MNRFNEYYDGVESVEIPIRSNTDTKYYLPNIPGLKGKIIKRISLANGLTHTPNNKTMISDANLKLAFLTIVNEKDIVVHRFPMYMLHKEINYLPIITELFNFSLKDTEKCYVEFSNPSGLSVTESLFINFFYEKQASYRSKICPLLNKTIVDSALEKREVERIYPLQVEVTDVNKTSIYFPDDEFLRNKKVKSIQCFADVSELVSATLKSPDDKTIIANTIYKKSFLVLQLKNGLRISNLPLNMLTYDFWLDTEILFNNLMVDWPKSYIKIANKTDLVANTVFYFLIHYSNAS